MPFLPGTLVWMLLAVGLVLDGKFLVFRRRGGGSPDDPLADVPLCGLDLLPLAWLFLLLGLPLLLPDAEPSDPGTAPPPPSMGPLLLNLIQAQLMPLGMILAGLKFGRRRLREVFLPGIPVRRAVWRGFFYGFALLPPAWLIAFAIAQLLGRLGLEGEPQPWIQWLSDDTLPPLPLLTMHLMALVGAPVVEELLFRGILFPLALRKTSLPRAVLASSVLFALAHLHFPSFLPLAMLGAVLALAYRKTGNILAPMIMHAVFNGGSLILLHAGVGTGG